MIEMHLTYCINRGWTLSAPGHTVTEISKDKMLAHFAEALDAIKAYEEQLNNEIITALAGGAA